MFVEQRTYDLAIGTQEQWLESYEKYGMEVPFLRLEHTFLKGTI